VLLLRARSRRDALEGLARVCCRRGTRASAKAPVASKSGILGSWIGTWNLSWNWNSELR